MKEQPFDHEAFLERHKDQIGEILPVLEIILQWVDVYNNLCQQFNASSSDGEIQEIMEILTDDMAPVIRKALVFNLMTKEQNEVWDSLGSLKYLRFGPKTTVHTPSREPTRERRRPKLNTNVPRLGREQSWTCFYCEKTGNKELGPDKRMWHVDHFYAQAQGGDSQADNLVLACATCNLRKGKKLLLEFLARLR